MGRILLLRFHVHLLASDHVTEFFGVEEVGDLTEDQINQVDNFRHNVLSEYSPLQWGFSSLYGSWESEQWEKES